MEYQEIKMKGKFWPEILSTIPAWSAGDEGRFIYAEDTEKFYIGKSAAYEEISMGDATTFLKNNSNQTMTGDIDPANDNQHALGDGTHRWSNIFGVTFTGTVTTATYADLAEKYTTKEKYSIGTILEVAYEDEFDLISTSGLSDCVVGVISEKPGFVMNQNGEGQTIGLIGRVPIRIIGPVYKQDIIVPGENGCGVTIPVETDLAYKIAVALETNLSLGEKLVECIIK